MVRRLRRGSRGMENIPIRDKHGKLLFDSEDRLEFWHEFFEELLNVSKAVNPDLINEIPNPVLSEEEENQRNAESSLE